MTKYLIKRLLHGLISVVIVIAIVMIMVYSLLNRDLVFAKDPTYQKMANNQQVVYKYSKWEEYGYLDYVSFTDYLNGLAQDGVIDEETRAEAVKIGKTAASDSELVAQYVAEFTKTYEAQGYIVERLDAKMVTKKKYAAGGQQQLFAHKDLPLTNRLFKYFTGIISVDTISSVQADIEDRGISFTMYDPLYGGEKFSPAIIGNGTNHKYLLYFDDQFPYIHQNLVSINLGKSYTVNQGIEISTTMTAPQGSQVKKLTTYPTGLVEESADNLHTATYAAGSREQNPVLADRFTDDYTNTITNKSGMSKMGYSFVIGILATILAYLIAIPMGIWTALKKDKLVDKIGTVYIIFISAVPSLCYIFMVKALGGMMGLPTTFDMEGNSKLIYILPVVSLALPSIGSLMKWLRRYMIDQMNADYVKFARSGGLSEGEIFRKHILKNAIVPLVHGIPASVLGALVGALITERVYVVPGAGGLLINAINYYDNSVIIGVTLFYAILSIVSIILGDLLMAMVDPRISFTDKAR